MLPVEGAADATATAVEDMGVDHGGGDVAVAEQLLDGSDVVAALQKVGRKRMAQGVAARGLGDAGLAYGNLDEPLQDGLVQVMAPPLPRLEVAIPPGGGEYPLPSPLARGVGVFLREGAGELDVPPAMSQIVLVLQACGPEMGAERI